MIGRGNLGMSSRPGEGSDKVRVLQGERSPPVGGVVFDDQWDDRLGTTGRVGMTSVPTMDVLEHLSLDAFGVMEGFGSGAAMRLQAQHSSGLSSGGATGGGSRNSSGKSLTDLLMMEEGELRASLPSTRARRLRLKTPNSSNSNKPPTDATDETDEAPPHTLDSFDSFDRRRSKLGQGGGNVARASGGGGGGGGGGGSGYSSDASRNIVANKAARGDRRRSTKTITLVNPLISRRRGNSARLNTPGASSSGVSRVSRVEPVGPVGPVRVGGERMGETARKSRLGHKRRTELLERRHPGQGGLSLSLSAEASASTAHASPSPMMRHAPTPTTPCVPTSPEGSEEVARRAELDDGTVRWYLVSGDIVDHHVDNSKIRWNVDGSIVEIGADGETVWETFDGVSSIETQDNGDRVSQRHTTVFA